MGASPAPDPRQVKTGQGHAAGPANGRYATVLSADSARRAAQLPCIALARYPDRSASGIAYLALACHDAAAGVAASWPRPTRCWARWPGRYSPAAHERGPRGSRLLECVLHRAIDPGGPAPRLGLLECRVVHLGAQRG